MTQLAVADEIAADLTAKAAENQCTTDDLLRSFISQMEWNTNFAGRVFTQAAKARIHEGIEASLHGDIVFHEDVEAFFEDWENELKA